MLVRNITTGAVVNLPPQLAEKLIEVKRFEIAEQSPKLKEDKKTKKKKDEKDS